MKEVTMSKQIRRWVGVTEAEYKAWCKENKKPSYKPETKADFFARIQDGRLVRDANGKLIKKYRRSK